MHHQIQCLRSELHKLATQNNTLSSKYKKSLSQIANIINVNHTLKHDVDKLKASYETGVKKQENSHHHILKIQNTNELQYADKKQIENLNIEIKRYQKALEIYEGQIKVLSQCKIDLLEQNQRLKQFNQKKSSLKNDEEDKSKISLEIHEKIHIQVDLLKKNHQIQLNALQKQKEELEKQANNLQFEILSLKKQLLNISHKTENQQRKQIEQLLFENNQLCKNKGIIENQLYLLKLNKSVNENQTNQQNSSSMYKNINESLRKMQDQLQQFEEIKQNERQRNIMDQEIDLMNRLSLQKSIQALKNQNKQLKAMAETAYLEEEKIKNLQKEIQKAIQQKAIFQQKICVLEAMNIVEKYRESPSHYNRLKQFEERVNILISHENKDANLIARSVHQTVILKAYVNQLSHKLSNALKNAENFQKKYQKTKFHLHQVEINQREIKMTYKKKIHDFDCLFDKLYVMLEKNFKETTGEELKKQFDDVISLKQSKFQTLNQENKEIKRQRQDIYEKYASVAQKLQIINTTVKAVESENKQLRELSFNLSNVIKEMERKIIEDQIEIEAFNQQKDYRGQILQKQQKIALLEQQIKNISDRLAMYENVTSKQQQSLTQQISEEKVQGINEKYEEEIVRLIERINYLEQQLDNSTKQYKKLVEEITKNNQEHHEQIETSQKIIIKNQKDQILFKERQKYLQAAESEIKTLNEELQRYKQAERSFKSNQIYLIEQFKKEKQQLLQKVNGREESPTKRIKFTQNYSSQSLKNNESALQSIRSSSSVQNINQNHMTFTGNSYSPQMSNQMLLNTTVGSSRGNLILEDSKNGLQTTFSQSSDFSRPFFKQMYANN